MSKPNGDRKSVRAVARLLVPARAVDVAEEVADEEAVDLEAALLVDFLGQHCLGFLEVEAVVHRLDRIRRQNAE